MVSISIPLCKGIKQILFSHTLLVHWSCNKKLSVTSIQHVCPLFYAGLRGTEVFLHHSITGKHNLFIVCKQKEFWEGFGKFLLYLFTCVCNCMSLFSCFKNKIHIFIILPPVICLPFISLTKPTYLCMVARRPAHT